MASSFLMSKASAELGLRRTSVGAAVLLALYGVPHPSLAQQTTSGQQQADTLTGVLQEVVVTATRRQETLEAVPYNITAITAEQLAQTGVTDIASLADQVPGLNFYNFGSRYNEASVPVIRGLNASDAATNNSINRTAEQSPVGVYLGNSPIDGYFQFDDIQRIEVLRGPQGTLYGAGALGGALRIIPNDPELGVWGGHIDASGGSLAHSSGTAYSTSATLNVPLADTLAFRATGRYAYEPGWTDVYGIFERQGSSFYAAPVLANPADPVNSPGIVTGRKDWNDQKTFTGRASLLWKPADQFSAELAFTYSDLNGDGAPMSNPFYAGGPSPVDPQTTLPAGGNYQMSLAVDEPYWRHTSLGSLDLSYDADFATLSATSSYSTTKGEAWTDDTFPLAGLGLFAPYYAGNPINPRYITALNYADEDRTFTQEVRLISKQGPERILDYTLGVFYEHQERPSTVAVTSPGTSGRAVAQGCTAYYFYGASFPNCLVGVGPNDTNNVGTDNQHFVDKSIFGELTWHFAKNGQITVGGRHFHQDFNDATTSTTYTFVPVVSRTAEQSSTASKNTWKVNPSYQYAKDQYVYATWSQGFRRGGANGIPLTGFYQESQVLASYAPDSVNNYELGLKGRFADGMSYTFAVFDIEWDKPQISTNTPAGNFVVVNGNTARSRGVEFESSGPLFLQGLTYTIGGAYADAKLTGDYSYPGNDGTDGKIKQDQIFGVSGEQMPGSAKTSAATTITYQCDVVAGYNLSVSLNATYRSSVILRLGGASGTGTQSPSPANTITNLSATLNHKPWTLGAYVRNLADRRVPLSPGTLYPYESDATLVATDIINPPREIGLQLSYAF